MREHAASLKFRLKALTDIHTGGIDRDDDRIHETGIIGSLRWWYEAVIRGFGAYACDPTADGRCPITIEKQDYRCPACQLFGCTGWSRKFRLRIEDGKGNIIQKALKAGNPFTFELIALKPITQEEQWLFTKTIALICLYGSIGGKTTLKPTKFPDFGIIHSEDLPPVPELTKEQIKDRYFMQYFRAIQAQKKNNVDWPDLRHFFFVSGVFLDRLQMNILLGLDNSGKPLKKLTPAQDFLQGRIGESKKVFAFHEGVKRIWGYVRDGNMMQEVEKVLSTMKTITNPQDMIRGEEVLNAWFQEK